MNIVLYDFQKDFENFLPLTYTRPVSELRCGILKISEKWQKYAKTQVFYSTKDYLQEKFSARYDNDNLVINSTLLPDNQIIEDILRLKKGEALWYGNYFIAARTDASFIDNEKHFETLKIIQYHSEVAHLENVWDIFRLNGQEIAKDFELLTKGRESQPISKTNTVFGEENIFIEEGAKVECSVLNATDGFIYIGKDAEIMENSVVRGSLALCDNAVLKVRTIIYGPTTIGPFSKVGGEINNSVIIGYSNKAHDGFLGNSVLGEWCNLGAGTNNSNLKNNYAKVKLWNYKQQRFVNTGLQFCGLIMGDHSKCGINTMFNTGTVVGVSANIYGAGFPRNFVPSFSWGGAHGFTEYKFAKAMDTAKVVMARRNKELDETEIAILQKVYEISSQFRKH